MSTMLVQFGACGGDATLGTAEGVSNTVASGSASAAIATDAYRVANSSASSTVPLRETAYGCFVEHKRAEHAANGVTTPVMALKRQWLGLSAVERDEFERKARERRTSACGAGSAAKLLRQQLLDQTKKPKVRLPDTSIGPTAKRNRKDAKEPIVQVPLPVFPQHHVALQDKAEQRRQFAHALRAQAEGRGAALSSMSSSGINLSSVNACLSGPTLSFDWQGADEWSESDDAGEGLEVNLPMEREARKLLQQELCQKISSRQVHSLVQRGSRTTHAAIQS